MDLTGQHIAILGAGRSGLGAARLARKLGGLPVVFDQGTPAAMQKAVDAMAAENLSCVLGLEAATQAVTETSFALAVISPGLDARWPLPAIFTAAGVPIIGEIEFAWRPLRTVPVVGITGTNGKTTTTELLERLLNSCGRCTIACGNYGHALSEVAYSGENYDVLTVEISSFQLETITTFQPKVALWLNFAPDHLDRYPDEKAYYDAKVRIFDYMTADDIAVVRAGENVGQIKAKIITFTTQAGVEADFMLEGETILFRGEAIGRTSQLPLQERHNVENEMAALGAGWALGLTFPEMLAGLAGYEAAHHRCELVKTVNGHAYVNDSKATNLHALESCLKSQDAPVVLIIGGKEKGLDYGPFRPLLKEKVTALVTIGEIGEKLATLFRDTVPTRSAATVPDSVRVATEMAAPGQAIVFSPGTSSFDMFSGYVERGNVFRDAVLALPEQLNPQEISL